MLSGARAQAMNDRTHHGIGGVQPGYLVRDQRRQVAWASIAIGARKQCCRPARSLNDIVIGLQPGIGPTRSEAHAMRVDDVGGQFTDGVVVEAQPCDRFGANVVDEDVGVAQQIAQYASVGILLEIEQERLLAAVERDIARCHPRRARGTRRVAKDIPAGCFHLDDLGAEIGEDLGCNRARKRPRSCRPRAALRASGDCRPLRSQHLLQRDGDIGERVRGDLGMRHHQLAPLCIVARVVHAIECDDLSFA